MAFSALCLSVQGLAPQWQNLYGVQTQGARAGLLNPVAILGLPQFLPPFLRGGTSSASLGNPTGGDAASQARGVGEALSEQAAEYSGSLSVPCKV